LFEQYDKVQLRLKYLMLDTDTNLTAAHAEGRTRVEEAYFQLAVSYERINSLDQSRRAINVHSSYIEITQNQIFDCQR